MAGMKKDAGKCRYDLIPPILYTYDALVYTMGADKYDDHNWTGGIKYSRLIAAAFRHIFKRLMGQIIDEESGLPHLVHARWNLGAIVFFDYYKARYKDWNDLDSAPIVGQADEEIEAPLVDLTPWREMEWYKQMMENKNGD